MPDILVAPRSICRVADGALLQPLSHLWHVLFFRWHFQISFVPSVLLKVRKTFTYEFSSGVPHPGKCREISPGFKSSKERMLQIYSSDVSFSYGHSFWVIPVMLSLEVPVFCCFGDDFPRCILGINTGQSGQGQALKNLVTGRSESGH